jgi:hypothetical protein
VTAAPCGTDTKRPSIGQMWLVNEIKATNNQYSYLNLQAYSSVYDQAPVPPNVVSSENSDGGTCLAITGSDYTLGPGVNMQPCSKDPLIIDPHYLDRLGWLRNSTSNATVTKDSSKSLAVNGSFALRSVGRGCCGDIFSFGT